MSNPRSIRIPRNPEEDRIGDFLEAKKEAVMIDGVEHMLIPFYEDYAISRTGSIYRLTFSNKRPHTKMLEPTRMRERQSKGYPVVVLSRQGVACEFRVHRLMLFMFVGKPPTPAHESSHLDGDPFNNHLSNLAWKTHKENMAHQILHGTRPIGDRQPRAKLKNSDIPEIRLALSNGVKGADLAIKYNVSEVTIYHIKTNKRWAHISPET